MANRKSASGKTLQKTLDDDFKAAINNPRNTILHKVSRGEMKTAEADAWARENEQPSFIGEPDPSQFDPMSAPDWTLAMATAWILWQTPDDVRNVWDKFVSGSTYWHQIGGFEALPPMLQNLPKPPKAPPVGHEPRQCEVSTPKEVVFDAVYRQGVRESLGQRTPLVAPEEAKRLLLAALRDGKTLQARHGIMADLIDRHVWDGLSPFDDGRGPHDAVFDLGRVLRFSRVRVERDAVLALWPVIPDVAPIAVEAVAVETTDAALEEAEGEATFPAAGRPSLSHFYRPEYERRRQVSLGLGSEREAALLVNWLEGEVREGRISLGGAALPSVSAIRKNIQRWRREEKDRTKNGPK